MIIKCLSLNQPYASLIVDGHKTIELRGWKTKHRGDFLIHSSKKSLLNSVPEDIVKKFNLAAENLPCGFILGKATLVDVINYRLDDDRFNDNLLASHNDRHLAPGYGDSRFNVYGFVLENPVKFEKPIPFLGQLNFFDVDYDEVANTAVRPVKRT